MVVVEDEENDDTDDDMSEENSEADNSDDSSDQNEINDCIEAVVKLIKKIFGNSVVVENDIKRQQDSRLVNLDKPKDDIGFSVSFGYQPHDISGLVSHKVETVQNCSCADKLTSNTTMRLIAGRVMNSVIQHSL